MANKTSSKILISAALAVLLVFGVSVYGTHLTGYQVAVGTIYNDLTVEPVNFDSIQIGGNTTFCSFAALRFTSHNSAFRFGNEQKNQVYWIAKNRTSSGCNVHNGYWIYQNSSSVYAETSGYSASRPRSEVGGRGIETNIRYYTGTTSVSSLINVIANGGFYGRSTRPRGNSTYVNITVNDAGRTNTSGPAYSGYWSITGVFGASSANGIPSATDLSFRDELGEAPNGFAGMRVRHTVKAPPEYCTPTGSCVKSSTSYQVRLNYSN